MLCLSTFLNAQTSQLNGRNVNYLMKEIEIHHISPAPRTLQHSDLIWNLFFEMIDREHLLFCQTDINQYKQLNVCDTTELFSQFDSCVTRLATDYKSKTLRYREFIYQYVDLQPNYRLPDTVTFLKPFEKAFSKTDAELTKRWELMLKYSVLAQCFTGVDSLLDDEMRLFVINENKRRKEFINRESCRLETQIASYDVMMKHLSESFFEAVANSFDPHTNYMPPAQTDMFMSSLSKQDLSFGLKIKLNDKNQIEIDQVTPGGPAWASHDFKPGDIIEKVQESGKAELDSYCGKLKEIYELIYASSCKSLTFTLRKKDGSSRIVLLNKQSMTNDENVVTGYLIDGSMRVGYIALPSFFENYSNINGAGCATDVAKEILKLKNDTIQALILDLRNNGGGAVNEALNLIGLFVDAGPLGMVRTYEGRIQTKVMRDSNRGIFYKGPLVVLVNKMSASATEIFAQSIKDYQRGVIVGTPTFGKATAQVMFPLGDGSDSAKFSGYLKYTLSKYYSLYGKSHQGDGVIPDILLPDEFAFVYQKENLYPSMLACDDIKSLDGFRPMFQLPYESWREASRLRVSKSAAFDSLQMAVKALDLPSGKNNRLVLTTGSFSRFMLQRQREISLLERAKESTSGKLSVRLNSDDKNSRIYDPVKREMIATGLKEIGKDIYIEEAVNIAIDMLQYQGSY